MIRDEHKAALLEHFFSKYVPFVFIVPSFLPVNTVDPLASLTIYYIYIYERMWVELKRVN